MECARTVYRMPCLNEDTQSWAIANWSEGEAGSGNGLGRSYLGQSLWHEPKGNPWDMCRLRAKFLPKSCITRTFGTTKQFLYCDCRLN